MVDFSYPHGASAGAAILANDHNNNWDYLKNFINGVSGNLGNYPGLLKENNPSATGNVTLGSSTTFYMNSGQQNVIGLATGTDITGNSAGGHIYDLGVPVGTESSYSNHYEYSKYDTTAGGGNLSPVARPQSQYRLVVEGSILFTGDLIGYTDQWTGNGNTYGAGTGSRIETQWMNVRENLDVGGYVRVMTDLNHARLFMGNDYSTNEDWLEWNDDIHTSQPGFGFHVNGASATDKSGRVLSISKDSNNYVDVRAPIGQYPPSTGPTTAGWPTISGSDAVINTGTQRLGITSSSIRFKEDVEDLETEDAWTKLRALKPRTFRWNREVAERSSLDYATQTPEPGFIAEEVHEAAPDTILYDAAGDPIVYRDKSMLAMLVKAVQDIDQRLGALE
jgi:hypothetical protein